MSMAANFVGATDDVDRARPAVFSIIRRMSRGTCRPGFLAGKFQLERSDRT
ncbi:MAG TPA: hypothetical protein VL475_10675 [Planctomycetaceae bacterium]|nr:hypothetical protein [Planctomycetaceae bacterium]